MSAVTLLVLLMAIETSMAAVDDCQEENQFWNGTACAVCSTCPPGFGVKEKCSEKQNTQCQPCLSGYDYSNTSGYQECILCDTYSNCLPGNHKIVKTCTILSPPVCDGCADGNYFDPTAVGHTGGCIPCLPPCGPLEVETRACKTAHDRLCEVKSLDTPILNLSNSTRAPPKEIPGSTGNVGKAKPEDPAPAANEPNLPAATTALIKKRELWIGVGSSVVLIAFVSLAIIKKKSNNRRKREKAAKGAKSQEMREMTALMPSPEQQQQQQQQQGLDRPIKDLTIRERKFITKRLNVKSHDAYFHWQLTAEQLGLRDECEAWKIADNPAEKFLAAYGEKEESTIRNLIKALRDPGVGLTLIAKEVEDEFAPPQDQDETGEARFMERSEPQEHRAQGEAAERMADTYV